PTPNPQEVIAALTPLYFARTAGMVWETQTMDGPAFEAYIDRQAHVFESLKPYLSGQWSVASGQ
ncbi:MAG: hypothetical protein HY690_03295, partial [Chloroflexi bacterium]|nr:hypothetical protein [Chloroflexota bacterium]